MIRFVVTFAAIAIPHLILAENATTPYRALCQFAKLDFPDSLDITKREVTFTVGSNSPGVKIEDLALFIDSKSGRIPLKIDGKGVMTLPISKELFEENPNVVANQPKGSMTMKVNFIVKGKAKKTPSAEKDGMMKYFDLFFVEMMKREAVGKVSEIVDIKKDDVTSAMNQPVVAHLRATEAIEDSSVTILAKAGDIPVKAVEPGYFVILFDPKLMEENPWIKLGSKHKWSIKQTVKTAESKE